MASEPGRTHTDASLLRAAPFHEARAPLVDDAFPAAFHPASAFCSLVRSILHVISGSFFAHCRESDLTRAAAAGTHARAPSGRLSSIELASSVQLAQLASRRP